MGYSGRYFPLVGPLSFCDKPRRISHFFSDPSGPARKGSSGGCRTLPWKNIRTHEPLSTSPPRRFHQRTPSAQEDLSFCPRRFFCRDSATSLPPLARLTFLLSIRSLFYRLSPTGDFPGRPLGVASRSPRNPSENLGGQQKKPRFSPALLRQRCGQTLCSNSGRGGGKLFFSFP